MSEEIEQRRDRYMQVMQERGADHIQHAEKMLAATPAYRACVVKPGVR